MPLNATEHHTRVMYDMLVKNAATPGGQSPDNNEDETLQGVNPNQLFDTERERGDIDAPWGEANTKGKGPGAVETYSDAAYEQLIESRQRMLHDFFGSMDPASEVAQATIGEQLEHGSSGDYESRAPLLERRATDPVKEGEAQSTAADDFADALLGE